MGIQTVLQCDNLQCKLPQSVRQGEWRVVMWGDQDVNISTYKPLASVRLKTKVVCCTACAIQVASETMGQVDELVKRSTPEWKSDATGVSFPEGSINEQ